jgi:hypothetical protein
MTRGDFVDRYEKSQKKNNLKWLAIGAVVMFFFGLIGIGVLALVYWYCVK